VKTKRYWIQCVAGASSLIMLGCSIPSKQTSVSALNETLKQIGSSAEQSFDYGTAAGAYRQVYERDPKDTTALLGMTRNLRYAGMPKESIILLKKALKAGSTSPLALLELGKAQLAAGLLDEALANLRRYRSITPLAWQAHGTLGLAYDRLGRHLESQESYRAALDLSPNNIATTNNLALSLAITGKREEAISMLDKIVRSENATPQVRQNLALLYALNNNLKGAERLISQDLPPEDVAWNLEAYRRLLSNATHNGAPPVTDATAQRKLKQSKTSLVAKDGKPLSAAGKTVEATADMMVRARPAEPATQVARLKKGETAVVLGSTTDENWYYLVLDSGLRGFVEQRLVKLKNAVR
jgi:Flp pilus assembly protein TadD